MLRVDISNTGFTVIPEPGKKYNLSYGFFRLEDEVNRLPSQIFMTQYWDSVECFEQKINESECYVYVAEKNGEQVIDERRFYFSKTGRKHSLSWTIEKLPWRRRFEENAHEITLIWSDFPECVRSEYIYLYHKNEPNERFQFLTDFIKPSEDKNGEYTARYIFFPQDGRDGSDYRIGFDPLLLEKYRVTEL